MPIALCLENNEEDLYLNHRELGLGNDANPGQNSTSAVISNAEINKLSSELNSRLSIEMDEMMNTVNTQIQRTISDAISNQILPQIQSALRAGSGHVTQNRWNVPAERPEIDPEDYRSEKTRNNPRSEPIRDRLNDNYADQVYDSYPNLSYASIVFDHSEISLSGLEVCKLSNLRMSNQFV